ncbi:YybH family protein [Aquimarina litoralis]|uniref:YybH family protein n=1 Tax=Aquimarina litoralis TaxID=584605 RepID=UPI001C597C60|nr:DUF4440 domain-containing protein [Aquimarina litoralis]MBW1294908.1 DUF4440 domain-containing protein [Aquimarina litoralis]
MKSTILSFCMLTAITSMAQTEYEPSQDFPFGRSNPEAPKEIKDFEPLIGICDCDSQTRNQDQSWAKPNKMTWEFKYIMNGMGVQDQTLKEDGKHSGSIRQFIADSSRWFVHYYSNTSPTPVLSTWEGNKKDDKIVLYRDQKAPNGMEGYFRLSFYDISDNGFKWIGEWVDKTEKIVFPTWKIACTKRKESPKLSDREQILATAKSFSNLYLKQDYEGITQIYTKDAKIFPGNTAIISGYQAIKKRWTSSSGYTPLTHKIIPEEIVILGDTAHDYGYYEGTNKNDDGKIVSYKGKYVVVWKKINGNWKMYLDIWNRVK